MDSVIRKWAQSFSASKAFEDADRIRISTPISERFDMSPASSSVVAECPASRSMLATRADVRGLSSITKARAARFNSSSLIASTAPAFSPLACRWRSSDATALYRISAPTRDMSAKSSTGLVRKSSAPTSSPRIRSSVSLSAVTMTTGM